MEAYMHADYLQIRQAYLAHFGTKGQRWGHRYHQSYDTAPTRSGMVGVEHFQKKRDDAIKKIKGKLNLYGRQLNAATSMRDVNRIINSLNADDRDKVLAGSDKYLNFKDGQSVLHRSLVKSGLKNVSFFDVLDDGSDIQLALATDNKYRGKGYGSKAAKDAMDWIDHNKKKLKDDGKKNVVYGVRTDNAASIAIAKKNGFKLDKNSYSKDKKWVNYVKKL